jgi:uncharacterized protein YecT (DUF1311 family)
MPRAQPEKSISAFNLLPLCGFILSPLLFGFCLVNKLEAGIFARDSQTELTVDPPGSGDTHAIFSFAHFANSSADQDFDFGGRLKLNGNLYQLEKESDPKSDAQVEMEGDLEGARLEVKTSRLTDGKKKSHELSGTYRKLSNEELQQRAQSRYDEADAWLNEVYGRAKAKLAASSFADLKKRETNWIEYRDSFAQQSAGINANIESLPEAVARLKSLRDLTMSRMQFIRSLLDDSLRSGISAVYYDEYGGELDLEKDHKGIKFRLVVVRGPTAHTGEVAGRVVLKNGRGTYRDPDPSEGEPPAEISFSVLDDRRIEIKARNDSYLRGARAYFDGVYFKSGPLTESIELE